MSYKKYSVLLFAFLFLVFFLFFLTNFISTDVINSILYLFESKMTALLIYFVLYVSLVLIGFPSTILTLSAGYVFGIGMGWLIDFIASMITASIAFYLARGFRKRERVFEIPVLRSRFEKAKSLALALEKYCSTKGFRTILLFRLSIVPFIVVSYAGGLIKTLKFRDFFLATTITNALFGFLVIVLGDSLRRSPIYIFIVVIVSFILFSTAYLIFRKKISEMK